MDPVSDVTLAWLERRATGTTRSASSPSIDDRTQIALTRVVRLGVEDAVRDVVTPGLQETALDALLGETSASRPARVAGRASLPKAFVTHLSPQFQALEDLGLEVQGHQFAEVLTRHIGIRLAGAAERHALPPTAMALLSRPPGYKFDIDDFWDYLNDDEGEEEEEQDDEEEGKGEEQDEQNDEGSGENDQPDKDG